MSQSQFDVMRGSPVRILGQRLDEAGAPMNISGETIESQVRAAGFFDDLTVTKTDAFNYELTATGGQTELWPIGDFHWNVKYTTETPDATIPIVGRVIEDPTR